nr:MAG TPA: hypothetical protein [Ackermannviridae sp.]
MISLLHNKNILSTIFNNFYQNKEQNFKTKMLTLVSFLGNILTSTNNITRIKYENS